MSRLLVTGSRDWDDQDIINNALGYWWDNNGKNPQDILVHGDCPNGADAIAKYMWGLAGLKHEPHPAQWDAYGRRAGMIRNTHMVLYGADACLAFIKNNSPGASHCAKLAEQAGIPTYRYTL